jgi:hypothetical protein
VTYVEPPTLVAVDSGVWVVRDSDYPVYYVDDQYWVYRDNVWYRSRYYDRDFVTVQVNVVPTPIVRRDHHAYVHFRGEAGAQTQIAPRAPERIEPRREAAPVVGTEAPPAGHGEVLVQPRERRDNNERANEARGDDGRKRDEVPVNMRRADEARPPEVRHDDRRQAAPAPPPVRRPEDEKPPEVKRDERRAAPAPPPARRIDEERAADAVRRQKSDEKKREDNKPQDTKREDPRRK